MNDQQYDNNNRGALFLNDRGGNEKAPNYKGSIIVDGVEYWCSLWKQTSQKGDVYLSVSVQPKEQQHCRAQQSGARPQERTPDRRQEAPSRQQANRIGEDDLPEIPF